MFRKTPRLVIAASHMGKRRGGSGRHMRYIVGSGKGRLGPMTYLQPLGDPQPLARPSAWKRMPGKEPRCRCPGTAFAERELVKRTMTYRERSSVKCVLTNLRFNESNAQRHYRNGYWSNVPRDGEPLQALLEHERSLKRQPAVGSWRLQRTATPIHRRAKEMPRF
jgi:hypothetical protein